MGRSLSIDQLLERWNSLEDQGATTTLETLCGRQTEELDGVKDKLRAVASMMSFLGLAAEPVTVRGRIPGALAGTEGHHTNQLSEGHPSPLRGSRYEVIRHLARGGLGDVYVALDKELGREVALKEIQERYVEDPGSRLRFVREAELTGRLEHPGVVPVYSLGRRDDGQPYYAMRFIQGDNLKDAISRYHDDTNVDPGARAVAFRQLVRNFIDVCYAVDYAHDRGILHRDIKPANVMLGLFGETLVVDWGLAKRFEGAAGTEEGARTDSGLTASPANASALTLHGTPVGTPAYMSPEQAAGGRDPLGPLSDVYSLGATLYCLLTGHAPFEGRGLNSVLQRVRQGDFPPPRTVRGEVDPALDAVCLKAMATKPEDRYPSARALVEDVERWMADEPVTAWREPFPVRARRWARRHRTAVTSGAAALFVMVAALGVILVLQTHAKRALEIANFNVRSANGRLEQSLSRERAATKAAESRFALALKAIQAYRDGVDQADVLRRGDLEPVRNKLLGSALTFYKDLSSDLAVDTSRNAAKDEALLHAYYQIAYLSDQIGSKTDAIQAYQQAVKLAQGLVRAGTTRQVRQRLGGIYHNLAIALEESGRADQALGAYREAVALRTALAAEDSTDLVSAGELAGTYSSFGRFRGESGRPPEALELLKEAITRLDALATAAPKNPVFRQDLAGALTNLGLLQMNTRDTSTALATFRRASQMTEALHAEEPTKLVYRSTLARIYNNTGILQRREGDTASATAAYRKAIALQEALALDYPAKTEIRRDLGTMHNNLGNVYSATGQDDRAEAELREAIRLQQSLVREYPRVASYSQLLGRSFKNLGSVLGRKGRFDDAVAVLGSAIDLQKELIRTDPKTTVSRLELGRSLLSLGYLFINNGLEARALSPLREAVAVQESLARDNPGVATYRNDLAASLLTLGGAQDHVGQPADGEMSCRRAIGLLEELVRENPADMQMRFFLGAGLNNLGEVLRGQRHGTAALAAFRHAVEHLEYVTENAHQVEEWRKALSRAYHNLAAELRDPGHVTEAVAITHKCRALSPKDPRELYNAACELAQCVPIALHPHTARRYSNEAMVTLRQAADAGWNDWGHTTSDPDLKPLHVRRDFQELVFDRGFPADPFAR